MSSKRNVNANHNWQTPRCVLDRVELIDSIMLDPCTTKDNPTDAYYIRTPECEPDGLATSWTCGGLVFVNPPYKAPWYRKILSEADAGTEIIALLMAKPGANYFQDLAEQASSVCFWRGRLTFVGAEAPAGFDSALLYFGGRPATFRQAFRGCGWLI